LSSAAEIDGGVTFASNKIVLFKNQGQNVATEARTAQSVFIGSPLKTGECNGSWTLSDSYSSITVWGGEGISTNVSNARARRSHLLVLDEFPYLLRNEPAVSSIFQKV
jgi:hypothetical protein